MGQWSKTQHLVPGGDFYYVPSQLGERLMTSPIYEVDSVGTFIEMFEDAFPDCSKWTEVPVSDRIMQIVARNKEWVQASTHFAVDEFMRAQKLKKVPNVLRPIATYFTPEIRKITGHYRVAEKTTIPLVNERKRTGRRATDLLYWMDEKAKGAKTNPRFLASILLEVNFATIQTSAAAPSQLIFDLCKHPKYIQPLRENYERVLDSEGRINKWGYFQIPKFDSIVKESSRFNPLLLLTFKRIIIKYLTLSNGFTIPANITIGVFTEVITMDPKIYPNPYEFDGFRFLKLREEDASMKGKGQYVASNPNSMAFGHGRHACSGRFFEAQ
ncbi:cytochrome P450 [Xylaria telfairii]|nr:cytochrome P450 [Xylaria telfairii]